MDLTIAREMIDRTERIAEEARNSKRTIDQQRGVESFGAYLRTHGEFFEKCGFKGNFKFIEENNCFEAVGKIYNIAGLDWLLTLTFNFRDNCVDAHLTRIGAQYSSTSRTVRNIASSGVSPGMKIAELLVTTERTTLDIQKKCENSSFENLRTTQDCETESRIITNQGYLTQSQREAALQKIAQRNSDIKIAIAKREDERQRVEAKYKIEQREAAEKLAQDKSFLQFVVDRIEQNNWKPFEVWQINYVPQNVMNIMESTGNEDEERLTIEELICTIYSELRMPNPSGLFDKITFSPYSVRPISLEGPLLNKELFRVESLNDKNVPLHFIRKRSYGLPGVYPTLSYRTPYFVNEPKLPTDEELVSWRKEFDASLKTE